MRHVSCIQIVLSVLSYSIRFFVLLTLLFLYINKTPCLHYCFRGFRVEKGIISEIGPPSNHAIVKTMERAGWPTLACTIWQLLKKKSVGVEAKIVTKILLEKILVLVKVGSVGEDVHGTRVQMWEGGQGPPGCFTSGPRAVTSHF